MQCRRLMNRSNAEEIYRLRHLPSDMPGSEEMGQVGLHLGLRIHVKSPLEDSWCPLYCALQPAQFWSAQISFFVRSRISSN